jgi:hypothetical protein
VIDASGAEHGFWQISISTLSKRDAEVMTDRAADDRLAYQRVLAECDPEVLTATEGMNAALVVKSLGLRID